MVVVDANAHLYVLADASSHSMESLCQTSALVSGYWIDMFVSGYLNKSIISQVALGRRVSIFKVLLGAVTIFSCGKTVSPSSSVSSSVPIVLSIDGTFITAAIDDDNVAILTN